MCTFPFWSFFFFLFCSSLFLFFLPFSGLTPFFPVLFEVRTLVFPDFVTVARGTEKKIMNGDRKGDSGYWQAQKASMKCKGTKIFVLRKSGYCPKEGSGVLGNVNYHFVRVETVSRLGCVDV